LAARARTSPGSLTDREWRLLLTEDQFQVAREHGTERAWTGRYNEHKEQGTYTCVCCGAPLFPSGAKFESGSGWPSFTDTVRGEEGEDGILRKEDRAFGMSRTEVTQSRSAVLLGGSACFLLVDKV
jgi:peptide-methionine (R)-S-oxide reductase